MFVSGLIAGIFVGANIGLMVFALLQTADGGEDG
jgi:F0F1-type ATP synthase assembly protein I